MKTNLHWSLNLPFQLTENIRLKWHHITNQLGHDQSVHVCFVIVTGRMEICPSMFSVWRFQMQIWNLTLSCSDLNEIYMYRMEVRNVYIHNALSSQPSWGIVFYSMSSPTASVRHRVKEKGTFVRIPTIKNQLD